MFSGKLSISLTCLGLSLAIFSGVKDVQADVKTRYLIRCSKAQIEETKISEVQVDLIEERDSFNATQYKLRYTYKGPDSLGESDGTELDLGGVFELSPEEMKQAYVMGPNGNELFVFSQNQSRAAFYFNFTVDLGSSDQAEELTQGYVSHQDGMRVNYSSKLQCKKS